MHPSADFVDGGRITEEEENEACDAAHDERHGRGDEERGGFESPGRNGGKVSEATATGQLPGEPVPDAVMKEPEVAGLGGIHAIPDPIRLDEAHHIHYCKTNGENSPQYTDRS